MGETDLRAICERLLDSCLGRRVVNDNMSVILVQFKAGARIRSSPRANPTPTATAEARAEIEVNIEGGGRSSNANEEGGQSCNANVEGGQSSNANEDDDDGSVKGCVGCFGRWDLFESGED